MVELSGNFYLLIPTIRRKLALSFWRQVGEMWYSDAKKMVTSYFLTTTLPAS